MKPLNKKQIYNSTIKTNSDVIPFVINYFSTNYLKSLVVIAFVLLLSTGVIAQLVSRPDRGTKGHVPFDAGFENINLQNGNVGLKIPLASLPSMSGGKLSYTLNAYYNSKIWDTRNEDRDGPPDENMQYWTVSVPYHSPDGGWRIGGKYGIAADIASNDWIRTDFSRSTLPDEQLLTLYSWQKTYLVTPEGAKHEIRPKGYSQFGGSTTFYNGYYKDTPYTTGTAMEYYTVDGSYTRVKIYPSSSSLKWEVFMPDGTKIADYQSYQRIEDSNGNKIKIFTDSQGTHYQDELTGREIRHQENQIHYQTVGGGWATITLTWGTTEPRGLFQEVTDLNCTYHEFVTSQPLSVLRQIEFQQTEPGIAAPKFTFTYNSDANLPGLTTYNGNCYGSGQLPYPTTAGWGELNQVTTPTGAVYKYEYKFDGDRIIEQSTPAANVIEKKTLLHDGETDVWNYVIGTTFASVTNPDGSTSILNSYTHDNYQSSSMGGDNGFGGLVYREDQSGKIRIERKWDRQIFSGADEITSGYQKLVFNPIVVAEYTSLLDSSGNPTLMSAKTFSYDYNGNVTQVNEYDWFSAGSVSRDFYGVPLAVPSGATLLRTTNTSYYDSPTSASSNDVYAKTTKTILNAVKETALGTSQTRFSYDGQSYGTSPVKGNLTKVSGWLNTTSQWLDTITTYDSYGNPTSITDPKGVVTQFLYEDSTKAFPTKSIVDPNNGTGQQITQASYDYATGLPLTSTDINGNVSSISYHNNLLGVVDPFNRQGTIIGSYVNVGGVNKRGTVKYFYDDNARKTRVDSDLFNENDGLMKMRESRDQIGRKVLVEKNENGAGNYTIFSQTIHKTAQRVVMQSSPSRGLGEVTDGWSRITTDNLGRTIEAATFSGATQPPVSGTNSAWTGSSVTSYLDNTVTVTDQAGKQRRSITNALGQLMRVDEPDDSGNLGTVTSPNQATNYTYDTLSNLVQVNQGVQVRTFGYDSLSRLRQAVNPESGQINYNYDNNGNLTQKTDARGVVTNYVYDNINRVTSRNYSDGTPTVTYVYENGSIPFSKGRLTQVSSSISTTNYNSFDNMGRVLASQQITDGQTYNFGYTYNLAGMLVEETYPSGRKVRNTFENDGDLALVETQIGGGNYQGRVGNFTYTAAGAVTAMQLGNGKWENTVFNSRLQPIQIGLGNSQTTQELWKVNYDYGTTDNNGNVKQQVITVPSQFTAIQNYTYDSLNRLKSATETIGGNQTWKQTFTFDRYGNRKFDASQTTTLGGCPINVCNPDINPNNNRITTHNFDNAGNTTVDAEGRQFFYDGENKQKEVRDGSNNIIGQYLYDGDGKRVKKVSAAETTLFIYDASGKMTSEYTVTTATPTAPQTSYLTNDTLGSPRVTTDSSGNVTSRRDFRPYGEEIYRPNQGTDKVRQKFTGYERDNESNLDYAKARMFGSGLGRFTSPDPFGPWAMTEKEKSAFYSEPQKWNFYVYVTNNPLRYSDPTGLERYDQNTVSKADEKKIREALKAILKYGTPLQKQQVRNIQKSDLLIKLATNTGGSGSSGVTDTVATQQKIDNQRLNEVQALGELTITIDSGTLATQKGIEGTLVHETRHASHQARSISEFSQADLMARKPYDPDGFTIEYSGNKAGADYAIQANKLNHPDKQAFVNEALNLGIVEKKGNGIGVSEKGIRARLANSYQLNDTTQKGTTFSQNWNLTPRNSW